MKTAIIIHGTKGYPEENWFSWLKEKLTLDGYKVIIPQFPTPKNQTPQAWFKVFDKYIKNLNNESIIIGHSLGGTFLLRILEKIPTKINMAVFVAPSVGIKPLKYYKSDKPFIDKPFDWAKIKKMAKHFLVFHSTNDPFICIENAERIANELGTKLIKLTNAGHFNAKSSYTKFELLYKTLAKV